tara:strand:- start:261 stop:635 length:375 start_codon:yes stop_codon:yes gene_type:complete
MVRSLSADMPGGVDLSKAKAWITFDGNAVSIYASFNVESLTRSTNPGKFDIAFSTPFKPTGGGNTLTYAVSVATQAQSATDENAYVDPGNSTGNFLRVWNFNDGGTGINPQFMTVICFGELEDE